TFGKNIRSPKTPKKRIFSLKRIKKRKSVERARVLFLCTMVFSTNIGLKHFEKIHNHTAS
ncbi:MAG: hypothetical protein Q4D38_15075, partial [Planctomycetia bacterium]|nr:hypothetical protein [Planctomycetia bacterium]